jgi:AcrR family transcriptional regulator
MKSVALSEARSELVRGRVLAGVAALLERGEALTFAAVSTAADVPERTIYRHFPTREALLGALYDWANARLGVDGERPTDGEGLTRLVRQTFPGFDALAPVVRELLIAPEGRLARLAQNPERQRAALALVRHEAPGLDVPSTRRLAAVLQLLTAALAWQNFRDYWGMDGAEAAETSVLASQLLLEAARARAGGGRPTPARRKKAARRSQEGRP